MGKDTYMNFTENTIIKDVYDNPLFQQMQGQFLSRALQPEADEDARLTLRELHKKNQTWSSQDIIYGLERLQEVARQNEKYVYSVYDKKDCEMEPEKKQTKLIHMPAKEQSKKTCAILLSGGAYGAVCTLVESLPVAARLNELGVTCFCLNYRTATPESFMDGLLPKPLEDLAMAWKFIKKYEEELEVDASNYIVGGFSAGGHITSLWGTLTEGYAKYHIPAPRMLLLGYPLITTMHMAENPVSEMLRTGMFGRTMQKERELQYSVHLHVTEQYPKVYGVLCDDDTIISKQDFIVMEEALKNKQVPYIVERGKVGGHGFGLGNDTSVKGWVDRAVRFLYD